MIKKNGSLADPNGRNLISIAKSSRIPSFQLSNFWILLFLGSDSDPLVFRHPRLYRPTPIEPGAGQLLQAPTSGESAVQYAALTAKQNSSECARVDPAALSRWLLVHVTFDSTLGFPVPRRGPAQERVGPLFV